MAERAKAHADGVAAIDLRIDELVLHGFRPADRHAVGAAVERELSHLFDTGGVPSPLLDRGRTGGGFDLYRLDAGSFGVAHDATPEAVGIEVARAIHRGLGGTPGPVTGASGAPGPEGAGR